MTILNNICVVVISRGRENILKRCIGYWENVGVQLVVVHKSDSPIDPELLSTNVTYIQHQGSFSERCGIAAQNLKGEFSILASDDELYLPSGLIALAQHLKSNPHVSSVGGQALALLKYGFKHQLVQTYSDMKDYSNSSEDAETRLEYNFTERSLKRNSGAMYRMYPTGQMKNFLELLNYLKGISCPYIFEVTAEIYWTLIGSSTYINEVFWIRNWIEPPVQRTDWNRKLYFFEWFKSVKFQDEVSEWIQILRNSVEFNLAKLISHELIELVFQKREIEEKSEIAKVGKISRLGDRKLGLILRDLYSLIRRIPTIEETIQQVQRNGLGVNLEEVNMALRTMTRK